MPTDFDEAAFRRSLTYSSTAVPSEVLQDLATIRNLDENAEHNNRFWNLVIAGCVLAMLAAIPAMMAELPVVAMLLGAAGLVSLCVSMTRKAHNNRLDVPNRRYELVAEVLGYLGKDIGPDETVTVAIDFRPHNHKSKFDRKGKAGKWNVKYFVDSWLTLSGRLMDGTKFNISMIEKHQDRSRTSTSRSGKTKWKSKTKDASEAILQLKVKPRRYPNLSALAGTTNSHEFQLPPAVGVKAFFADDETLRLRTTSARQWDVYPMQDRPGKHDGVTWLATKLMTLYGLLNSARQSAKGAQ
ncbi:MAG: hypothetical protein ABJZ55_04665 [Fuerstiella sp.]